MYVCICKYLTLKISFFEYIEQSPLLSWRRNGIEDGKAFLRNTLRQFDTWTARNFRLPHHRSTTPGSSVAHWKKERPAAAQDTVNPRIQHQHLRDSIQAWAPWGVDTTAHLLAHPHPSSGRIIVVHGSSPFPMVSFFFQSEQHEMPKY